MNGTEFEISAGITGLTATKVANLWDAFVASVQAAGGEIGGGVVPLAIEVSNEQSQPQNGC